MRLILVFIVALMAVSCFEQGDCSDISSQVFQVGFYDFDTKKAQAMLIDSVLVVGTDSVFHKNVTANSVKLPIDPNHEITEYHFYYANQHATLLVTYSFQAFALAPECSAIEIASIQKAEPTLIQEVTITRPDLTNNVSENLRLYF